MFEWEGSDQEARVPGGHVRLHGRRQEGLGRREGLGRLEPKRGGVVHLHSIFPIYIYIYIHYIYIYIERGRERERDREQFLCVYR